MDRLESLLVDTFTTKAAGAPEGAGLLSSVHQRIAADTGRRLGRWPGPLLIIAVALVVAAAVTVPVAVLGGGAHDRPGTSHHPAGAHLVRYSDRYLSFVHPAVWRAQWLPPSPSSESTGLVSLSTQRLHNPCVRRWSAGSESITCTLPLHVLAPNGVLVQWGLFGQPASRLSRLPGRSLRIGGRAAKEVVYRNGGACAKIHADEEVGVTVSTGVPANFFWMSACLRGPDLASEVAGLNAMLRSVRFTGRA